MGLCVAVLFYVSPFDVGLLISCMIVGWYWYQVDYLRGCLPPLVMYLSGLDSHLMGVD